MFVATGQRRRRNVLAGPLHPAEVRHLSCFNSEFEKATKVYGALATLAMGDAQAVEIAQTCHVSMALQGGTAGQGNLLNLSGFHPRSSTMVGIIIDDFVSLSIVDRSHSGPLQCSVLSDKMDSQYDAVGLISHKEKGFRGETQGSFWGVDIDGEEGLLRGSLKRAIPLVGILIRTAKLGHASVGLLQILAGSIVSLFLFRRRFLAILDYIYRACRGRNDRDIVKLSGRALSELLVAATLIPIAVSNLRAQKKPRVIATDASSWGIGAVVADAPLAFVEELHRYALRKPVWSKLLSPSKAWLRMHCELPAEEELPEGEEHYKINALSLLAARALNYRVLFSEPIEKKVHINISEVRAFLKTERDLGRKERSVRDIYGLDSQVGLGCLIKGRSSSRAINNELSRSLPSMIIFDSYPSFIFFDSGSNPADDPTRGVELRSSSLEFPTWLQQLCDGDTRDFDAWVAQHGLGYQEMTGLPPFEELLGDAARSDQEDVLPSPVTFSTRGELSDFADQEPKDIAVPGPSSDHKGPLTKSTESIGAGASLGFAAEDPAPRGCISPFELRRKDKLDCHLQLQFQGWTC